VAQEITQFAQLGLAAPVLQVLDEVGYEAPYPIQARGIPPLLEGRDLLGQAQTGTGKTATFALPLLCRLNLAEKSPQALVLTPTRELAIQVAEAMQTYARHLPGFHVLPVYGGQSIEVQLARLRRGVHIVVGTPGRLLDHLRRKTLDLKRLTTVVLDEADEMLRMGFLQDVEEILEQTPREKQVALFSATMPDAIGKVALRHLRDPVKVVIRAKTATVEATAQRYWLVTGVHKLDALTRILEVEEFDAMLIFVRWKAATVELAEKLEARGFSCGCLNGDMTQALRERTVERLRKGKTDILVATDVAARGLDIDRISHVVNFDVPHDTESYVHRIGRTGRAGRKGVAILFVSPRERRMLRAIERATRQPITPMQLPTHKDVTDRRIRELKTKLSSTIEAEQLGFYEELITDYQYESGTSIRTIAGALAFLTQGERPLLPPPPPPTPPRSTSPRREGPRPPRTSSMKPGMERYRIEVGLEHGVHPKHIVGAIANEADLEGKYIGPITLHDEYSTVDLPEGMPKALLKHLRRVWVCGRQLQLGLMSAPAAAARPRAAGDKPDRPRKRDKKEKKDRKAKR